MQDEQNVLDSPEKIRKVLQQTQDLIWKPDNVDMSRIWRQEGREDPELRKSFEFIREYAIVTEDVRNILDKLTIEEYSCTSKKKGFPDAYVFGVFIDGIDDLVYLKYQVVNNIIIISLHLADREMDYPYRREQT